MAKTVADIVYEPPVWDKLVKIGLYIDFIDTDSKVQVGRITELDLQCGVGLKYYIIKYKEKDFGQWINDKDIVRIHKFPKRRNG